ncbi:MAG: cytochrome D1 domain-containing protein [Gammaproteobacteria bacterium]|nr:cytochrome D1 domain-containing protein [Gammaproteobacteria bacterium]
MRIKSIICTYSVIAMLSLTRSPPSYASDVEMGKQSAASCVGCHGINGISNSPEFPNLAGQKEGYLFKQLKSFKDGTRNNPTMKAMATTLSDVDMNNLAAYFSSLQTGLSRIPSDEVLTTSSKISTTATEVEFPETVFISMKKSGTVETFPGQVTWAGGPNMLYNAVTPDGKRVLSTSSSSNTVYVFDASSGKQLAIIPVGKAPKGVKVTPDGKFAYVSNEGSASLSVIDLDSLSVVNSIKVEDAPHNVRFTKDGQTAYVTLQGGAGIGVVDTKTQKMIRVIPVPGITGPHNIDLSADENMAFVRDFVHHVAVLDLRSGKVKKVITVGNGHGGIDVSPDGKYVATAAIGDHIISIIDPQTLAVINIEVGNGPHGIRASKDSKWIYVTLTGDNAVAVINAETMKLENKIAAGEFPFWVVVLGNP